MAPQQAFERLAAAPHGETACPDGLEPRAFRPVRFGPHVSHMTLDIEAL